MKVFGRWLYRFAALLGLLHILITATPLLRYWNHALTAPWGQPEGDTMIVLSAESSGRGVIGINSYWRCFNAILTWRQAKYTKMIISGRVAAAEMRDFVVAYGIPREAVILEDKSDTTRENALYVASMLRGDKSRKVLVTSDYHSLRALKAFRRAGVELTAWPSPDAGKRNNDWTQRWVVFLQLAGETVKLAGYQLRGWV